MSLINSTIVQKDRVPDVTVFNPYNPKFFKPVFRTK